MHIDENLLELLEKLQLRTPLSPAELISALSQLEEGARRHPTIPVISYEQGNILRQLGRSTEALSAYDETIRLAPDNHYAHLARSLTLTEMQHFEEALTACEQAIQLLPSDQQCLMQKGNLLMLLNKPNIALAVFETILQDAPQHIEAILGKRHVLHSMRNELTLKDQFDFIDDGTLQQPVTSQTKFGGQPDWLETPTWPISRTTGEPMQFIAQITINPEQFPNAKGKIAYLFMADTVPNKPVPAFWESDSGDNAVIIQPGGELVDLRDPLSSTTKSPIFAKDFQPGTLEAHLLKKSSPPQQVEVRQLVTGPSYCEEKNYRHSLGVEPVSNHLFEFDDTNLDKETISECVTKTISSYRLMDTKIGGMPFFLQATEYPAQPECQYFLAQISLLDLDLADGIFYVFLNETATKGAMLYQR